MIMAQLAKTAPRLAPYAAKAFNPITCSYAPVTRAAAQINLQPQQRQFKTCQPRLKKFEILYNMDKLHFGLMGFNQYGLLYHDILNDYLDVIKEAVGRLPDEEQDARAYRITRALQCSVEKTVLPKEEWTTYEDHLERGKYLQPYIDQVEKEFQEIADWNKQ